MILGQHGSRQFLAHDEWHNYCAINNIQDPWQLMRSIENEYKHTINKGGLSWEIQWDTPNENQKLRMEEAKKYRDQYICNREVWVGNYLLKNYGYNELTTFAQTHRQEENAPIWDQQFWQWMEQVNPCDGADHQCNFHCAIFNNCPYRDQGLNK